MPSFPPLSRLLDAVRTFKPKERKDYVMCIDLMTEMHMYDHCDATNVGSRLAGEIFTEGWRSVETIFGFPVLWGAPKTEWRKIDSFSDEEKAEIDENMRPGRGRFAD